MRFLLIVVTAGLIIAAPTAHACGHCKEDKIAATYDYSVISAAHRKGQVVAFVELRGVSGPTAGLDTWVRQQGEAVAGVAKGTVRVSLDPAAMSFACERPAVATVMRAIGQKLARRGLRLSLIEAQAAPKPKSARSASISSENP